MGSKIWNRGGILQIVGNDPTGHAPFFDKLDDQIAHKQPTGFKRVEIAEHYDVAYGDSGFDRMEDGLLVA